jgi:hypothetical protein
MHIAEHTGLTGSRVQLEISDGRKIFGEIRAECPIYFYFLQHSEAIGDGMWKARDSQKVRKDQVESLEVIT